MKLKKILSGFLAAAMAVTTMVTANFSAGAAEDVELSSVAEISYTSLQKYSSLTFTYEHKKTDSCSHKEETQEAHTSATYCPWSSITMVGVVKDENGEVVNNYWYQPKIPVVAQAGKDEATSTSTLKVSSIISSFENDEDWQSGYVIEKITFGADSCTVTKVVGTPVDENAPVLKKVNATIDSAKVELPKNTYSGGWNWQGVTEFEVAGYTSESTTVAGIDISTLTLKFKVAGATSGEDAFDVSKLSYSIQVKIHKGEDWSPWLVGGTSSYNAATKEVTVTADIDSMLDAKYSEYVLNSFNLVVATSSTNSENPITLTIGEAAATEHDITVTAPTNGTVTPDKTTAAKGDTVTLTVAPATGYELDTLTVTPSATIEDVAADASKKTFTMPDADVTVSATFKAAAVTKYNIAVTAPTNGTVTVKNDGGTAVTEAAEGDKITITAEGKTGYELDTLTVTETTSGTAVTVTDKTFTMPDADVTVTATFKAPLTGITLDKTATVLVGAEKALTATKLPDGTADTTTIEWTSSDETVATVDQTGKVTGKKAGTATITAKCGTITATCEVTVSAEEKPCTAIALDKTTAEVKKGESVTLKATPTPADTTDDITWKSGDETVATVDQTGKVTGVARGTATITVKCGDQTATCEVSVTEDKTVTAPVTAGGAPKSYDVVTTAADGTKVKTVDTVYAITEADLQCKGYTVTITNTSNGKSITREITNAYKSVTVKSAEDLGNDTFTGYFLVVRVKNVPENVTLSYKFDKIS